MIPISILTGFLGSGKTTILAHLLRDPALSDTAVVINEFGDVGLDHDLIESSDETTVTLQTGCLCCKMQDDLVATLHDLLSRREAGSVPQFERIVVETSGLSDPAPILQSLMVDEALAERITLARVLTVVDAVNGMSTLSAQAEARRQVAVADRLALSKADLIEEADAGLRDHVQSLNPSATLLEVSHGKLDADVLFPSEAEISSAFDMADTLVAEKPAHSHHSDIHTFAIQRDAPIAAVALSLFLEALADHCGADLLRLKGLVCVAENPDQPAVIHGVQHVFHPPQWLDAWPGHDKRTRMVFIGRGISEAWVQVLLDAIEIEVGELVDESDAENSQRTRQMA